MIAAILNHLWQSTLFAGAAGLLALALHRNGAHVRFWLWFAASLKFLVPFAAVASLSAYMLPPVVAPVPAPTVKLIEPLAKPFSAPATAPAIILVAAKSTAEPSAAPMRAHDAPPARAAMLTSHMRLIDWEMALLALWFTGFTLLASRWLLHWSQVRKLLDEAVAARVEAPIAVKFSTSLLEPGLVGILDPVILLPQGIEQQLSPAELKAVLAHELCHWRRRDNLLAAIHMAVEALFWFFPLVWWLGGRLNTERERACDESVLADGNDPGLYAEGILKVCRAYLQSPLICVSGISGAGLKKRIATIMENRLIHELNAARKFVLSAAAAAALALPLALGLLTTPVAQIPARAAQILLSPVPQKLAALPVAPQAIPSSSQAADSIAPLVPKAAAAENTAPDRNSGDALTRPNTVTPETSSAPLPDPSLAQTPANTAPTMVAANDQTPNPAQVANTTSCAAPQLLNSLTMEPTPGGDTMTVATSFDGKPHRLLIGISDTPTQLWDTPANNLHLPIRMGRRIMDGAGRISEEVSRLQDFTLGSMKTGNFDIQIGQDPDFENAGFDGILGTDMMMRYDIDLDFAHRRMNYFSPEACKGAGVYWSPARLTQVPMKTYANVVYVPVTVDGHTLVAVLDTSASRTFLNPRTADQLFGVKADGLEPATVTEGGSRIKAGLHRFSGLTLGAMTFSNPELAVPFDVLSQSYDDSHISRTTRNRFRLSEILPDIVIGMDVLKQTHLYLSFQSGQVYVSPAGDGQVLKQQAPTETSWFNVWRHGYDPYYNFRHPDIKF